MLLPGRPAAGLNPPIARKWLEKIIDMYPMDFGEFLWANGITEPVIGMLKQCPEKEAPVPKALHNRVKQLLLHRVQRDIARSYEDEMVNNAGRSGSCGSCESQLPPVLDYLFPDSPCTWHFCPALFNTQTPTPRRPPRNPAR